MVALAGLAAFACYTLATMMDITVTPEGRSFFVQVNGITLGRVYKIGGFQGESPLRFLLRMALERLRLDFRPLWGASALPDVFSSRDAALTALLEHHSVEGITDLGRAQRRYLPRGTPPAEFRSNIPSYIDNLTSDEAFEEGRRSMRSSLPGGRIEENERLLPRGNALNEAEVEKSARDIEDAIHRLAPVFGGDEKAAYGYQVSISLGICPHCGSAVADRTAMASSFPRTGDDLGWSRYCQVWSAAIENHAETCPARVGDLHWDVFESADGLRWPVLVSNAE